VRRIADDARCVGCRAGRRWAITLPSRSRRSAPTLFTHGVSDRPPLFLLRGGDGSERVLWSPHGQRRVSDAELADEEDGVASFPPNSPEQIGGHNRGHRSRSTARTTPATDHLAVGFALSKTTIEFLLSCPVLDGQPSRGPAMGQPWANHGANHGAGRAPRASPVPDSDIVIEGAKALSPLPPCTSSERRAHASTHHRFTADQS
jgi:hypothetical protein